MKKSILMLLTLTMIVVLFACGEDKNNPTEPNKNANIIAIVPKSAFVGDTITVIGTNFGESQGTSYVSFAGIQVTEYIFWNDNEIVIKVPIEAKSGKVWIVVNDEKSNEVNYIVLISTKPKIISIIPQSAFISDFLSVSGKNFGKTREKNYVSFAGMIASDYSKWNDTVIEVRVPEGVESGKLWLEVNDEKTNEVDFNLRTSETEVYSTVTIGTQVWMLRNLDVTHYRNGDPIRNTTSNKEWDDAWKKKEGAWCYYNNDPKLGAIYGKLYNGHAVKDPRGLAPQGYHIPQDDEWTILEKYLGGWEIAGGKLKNTGIEHWYSPNIGATNSSGFTALPGGLYNGGGCIYMNSNGYWWSLTEFFEGWLGGYSMYYDKADLRREDFLDLLGFSVRCIKD